MADTSKITFASTTPRWYDAQPLTLQKMLQSVNSGTTTSITGEAGVSSGHGAPVADPGVDNCVYYDLDTGLLYYWNDGTSTWI